MNNTNNINNNSGDSVNPNGVYVNYGSSKFMFLAVAFVAVLTLAVGSVSFAYFAASTSNSANVNVNMNTLPAGGGGSCSSSGSGTVTVNPAVTNADMFPAANSTTAKVSVTSGNLVMTATPPDASTKATCSYNLTWMWTSTGGYTQSNGVSATVKEMTYQLQKWNGSAWADVVAETQFPTAANTNAATIKSSESVAGNGAAASATYHIIVRWYNANVNQNTHIAKTYTGRLAFASTSVSAGAKS